MAEIEITLPTVQYGNIKITATPEEWGLDTIADAPDVGVWAATYLNLFTQGFKYGSQMDVDAHLGASGGPSVAQAAAMLNEGLGGVTDVQETDVVVVDEPGDPLGRHPEVAPWDKPPVDSKPKPWENEATW